MVAGCASCFLAGRGVQATKHGVLKIGLVAVSAAEEKRQMTRPVFWAWFRNVYDAADLHLGCRVVMVKKVARKKKRIHDLSVG